jgi:hypothetical protein
MELILIIILLIVLFGGGFGYYRGGYYSRGGGYGIGGILGVVLIVVLIVWLLRGAGYVGGFLLPASPAGSGAQGPRRGRRRPGAVTGRPRGERRNDR